MNNRTSSPGNTRLISGPKKGLLLLAGILLLLAISCRRDKPLENIRHYAFSKGTTLAQAYSQILDNSRWEITREGRKKYVCISGLLKGERSELKVYYDLHSIPPVVDHYTRNGQRASAADFADFLSALTIQHAILDTKKSDAPAATE